MKSAGAPPLPRSSQPDRMDTREHPRVFLSYSHDSAAHGARVLALAERLGADGCDCALDQYDPHPAEGWPQWMDRELDSADFVLVVCTADYYRKSKAGRQPGSGRGVKFESVLVVGELYAAGMWNERFIPVLFGELPEELILRPLRGFTRYRVDRPDGYEALLRHLTGQPLHPRPRPGKVPDLPPARPKSGKRRVPTGARRRSSGSGLGDGRIGNAAQQAEAAGHDQVVNQILGDGNTVGPLRSPSRPAPTHSRSRRIRAPAAESPAVLAARTQEGREEREYAERIRSGAALLVARLERWQQLSLQIFSELQPLITEADMLLTGERKAVKVRDVFWHAASRCHVDLARRKMDEHSETASSDLYGYDPRIQDLLGAAMQHLREIDRDVFSEFLAASEQDILVMAGRERVAASAELGNLLRNTCGSQFEVAQRLSSQVVEQFREEMRKLSAAADRAIVDRTVELRSPVEVFELPAGRNRERRRPERPGGSRDPWAAGTVGRSGKETERATGARRALVIGIDRYPKLPSHVQLDSCVNDAQALAWLLISRFSFREHDIERLMDSGATRAGIRAAVRRLLERVGQEDVVVLYYSGFGSVVRTPEQIEGTIVPYDSGRAAEEVVDIGDDEIGRWLRQLAQRCAHVVFIFDSCHSGQILRDGFGAKERYLGPERGPAGQRAPASPTPAIERPAWEMLQLCRLGTVKMSRAVSEELASRCVVLAACAPAESAFTLPAEQAGGVSHGAFTYRLCQALAKVRGGTTYRELFEEVAPQVTADLATQHPQFRGDGSIPIFGLPNLVPIPYVRIRQAPGQHGAVVLDAGVASGVTAGSTWDVYPPELERFDTEVSRLGRIEVTRVSALQSEARVVEGSLGDAGAPGAAPAHAVESTHRYSETVYSVEIQLPALPSLGQKAAMQRLRAALEHSPVLRLHRGEGMAAARLYLLAERRVVADSPVPVLGPLAADTWAAVGRDGALLLPAIRASEPAIEARLIEKLEERARRQFVMDLTDPGGPLTGQVRLALLGRDGERWVERGVDAGSLASGEPVFRNREQIAFQIAHTHSAPLYFCLLDLGLSGAVTLIYPVGTYQKPATSERATLVGVEKGEEITISLPSGFPFEGAAPPQQGGWIETVMLFATTHEDGNPVGPLLETSLRGHGTRSSGTGRGTGGHWTVVQRSFRLVP
jgi:hypothetical protein